MSPLVLGELLGMIPNPLTAEGKYPLEDWKNWQLAIQMHLSEKRNLFSEFFVPFLESTSNLRHFEKRIMVIANVFPKLQTKENLVRPPCKKRCFGTRFDSQHVKVSQILAKYP